jgi:hypothetical protein
MTLLTLDLPVQYLHTHRPNLRPDEGERREQRGESEGKSNGGRRKSSPEWTRFAPYNGSHFGPASLYSAAIYLRVSSAGPLVSSSGAALNSRDSGGYSTAFMRAMEAP